MKQHFGQMFLGVCIVIAALIFTHPPKRETHHYQWHVEGNTLAVLDTETGDIFALRTNGTWFALKPIPVRQKGRLTFTAADFGGKSK